MAFILLLRLYYVATSGCVFVVRAVCLGWFMF